LLATGKNYEIIHADTRY